jgi:hypothetical protein
MFFLQDAHCITLQGRENKKRALSFCFLRPSEDGNSGFFRNKVLYLQRRKPLSRFQVLITEE